jgi:hypothetical protein
MAPSRTAAVVTKTLAATAMAGAQTMLNNHLNAVAATATETARMTATTTTMKTKVMAAMAAAWRQSVGGGSSSVAAATLAVWRCWQLGKDNGND